MLNLLLICIIQGARLENNVLIHNNKRQYYFSQLIGIKMIKKDDLLTALFSFPPTIILEIIMNGKMISYSNLTTSGKILFLKLRKYT